jgi:beta-N-acetylhexosaminidase
MYGISPRKSRLTMTTMTRLILTDIDAVVLSAEDRDIIEHPAIFGILLFTRNYESPRQLKALCHSIRRKNPNVIIAVDQEGGRIQRFTHGFTALNSMQYWGDTFDKDPEYALEGLKHQTATMAEELQNCGVQVSLAPVLDLNLGLSEVIGDRSFHSNPEKLSQLAKCVIDTMHQQGMPTIGKHFPGHGGVALDSHSDLPIDHRSWDEIWQNDMLPYRHLTRQLDAIMPAHIIFDQIDDKPACFSKHWIQEVLQNKLQYKGLVMTDCLSMAGAASMGSYEERGYLALEAGCDILTLCNDRNALYQVLDNIRQYASLTSQEATNKYLRLLH